MDLNKFTQKAQEAIIQAQQLASDFNHQTIEPVHLLLALLNQENGVVPAIVTKVAGSPIALREEIQKDLEGRSRVYGGGTGQPALSQQTVNITDAAERYAKGMSDEYISTEHLLLESDRQHGR